MLRQSEKGQIVWLSLEAAIAWVVTRDAKFTNQVQQVASPQRLSLPESGDDWDLPLLSLPAELRKPSLYRPAWLKLRFAIASKGVKARGYRGPQEEEISDVSSLVIESTVRFSLAIETYPLEAFKPWQKVKISQGELLREFPPLQAEKSSFTPRHGKGRITNSVVEALENLAAKNGGDLPSQWSAQTRWDEVNKWLMANGYKVPAQYSLAEGFRRFKRRRKSNQ